MTVNERIRMCLILEAMDKNKETAEKCGLKDVSFFKDEAETNKEEVVKNEAYLQN